MNTEIKLSDLTAKELQEAWEINCMEIENINSNNALIIEEITRRYSTEPAGEFKYTEKLSGSKSFEVDGIKLKFEISKKVEWDSAMLMKIAATLSKDIAKKIFQIKFSVPAKTFDALTDANLIKALGPARTVQYGQPTVTFVKD